MATSRSDELPIETIAILVAIAVVAARRGQPPAPTPDLERWIRAGRDDARSG